MVNTDVNPNTFRSPNWEAEIRFFKAQIIENARFLTRATPTANILTTISRCGPTGLYGAQVIATSANHGEWTRSVNSNYVTVDEALRALFVVVGWEVQTEFEKSGRGMVDREFDVVPTLAVERGENVGGSGGGNGGGNGNGNRGRSLSEYRPPQQRKKSIWD
ncbi:hypothetical protein FKW77_003965 [Venturia effusa]|uniref:Uncharacterized protein n=1 Tax=Venturia effusa TaxID=50376 RepID=A0A517L565_9PEZI|nr:hypothetical protein FKW77_003965 [Venturia effusa]